jgi:Arc/MetJ-type ribon-helix-helix transcriptional regulator
MIAGMATTQITVRIPDDLVQFADAEVEHGRAKSRAEIVATALGRERRRQVAERDAAIYAALGGAHDEFADLSEYAETFVLDID